MAVGPTDQQTDARWPKLLSLTVHEFRSPLTVVSGYIRMLLRERAGPMSDQQRRLLEEADKSCQRLSALLIEVSEVSQLEAGTATFNRSTVDLAPLLADVIANLPALPDRQVDVDLRTEAVAAVHGDATRLRSAFAAIITALRREMVSSDRLVVIVKAVTTGSGPSIRVTVGEADRIEYLAGFAPSDLVLFDEWRGGLGLSLAAARRIIEAHDGRLLAPADEGKTAAIISLPAV
jgi:signal transduction histidine kinase